MQMSSSIMRLTLSRSETSQIQEQARKEGMTLLVEDGLAKVRLGLTTLEEVLSVASSV